MKNLKVVAAVAAFGWCWTAMAGGPGVQINEIRIDQPGTDNDEYFELSGPSNASLDGLTYLVIGDGAGGSGTIEAVVDLTGQTLNASGLFLAAEDTMTLVPLGSVDLVLSSAGNGLNFENSDNVTHLLVEGFSGLVDDDLDLDDDGVLDVTPWTAIVDLIALVEEPNPPGGTEYHYGPPQIGPDGAFVPGHVYRCVTAGAWFIGPFDPSGGVDTPGATNAFCECGNVGSGNCYQANGSPFCDDVECCDLVCLFDPTCCSVEWDADCAATALAQCTEPGPAPDILLNEIRTGQGGSDNDEYFEILGSIGTSLDGVAYIVLGDGAGDTSGIIENVTFLGGNTIFSEVFLVAESTFTLNPGAVNLTADLNFEDSDNVTHLLVFNFTGQDGDDLDLDDDGILDIEPWGEIIDSVAIVGPGTPGVDGNHIYSTTVVGPDDIFTPGHVYICDPDGWVVGDFFVEDPCAADTPGSATNAACTIPLQCGCNDAGSCFEANGTPYCEDAACCDTVIALDPDCALAWDQDCANLALVECLACGDAETGGCLEANGTPYCNDLDCCNLVCGATGFEFCCTVGWDQACADLANSICNIPALILQNDLVFGLNDSDGFLTLELVRGLAVENGGVVVPDFWDEPFMQSVEFDNLDGILHNPQGNLLGVNFGATATGGTIHSFATCVPTSTDQLIGDTTGLGGDGVTLSRLGGLSVSPDNTKIAVTGYDTAEVLVYDYVAGDCQGAGAALSGARQTSGSTLFAGDTQGTTWLDDNTVLAFSSDGDIFQVDATTMVITPGATVDTIDGGGPGGTDIEYNPAVSPYIYAMYNSFTGTTRNLLFVLDSDFNLLGTYDYSTSINTAREIALDSNGNLFVSAFGGAVDVILGASDLMNLADNNSLDWYTSTVPASFSGVDVAAGVEGGGGCPAGCGGADLSDDGQVNASDLAQLLGNWGDPGCSGVTPCCADLTGDGVVNASDLAQLLGIWGPCN